MRGDGQGVTKGEVDRDVDTEVEGEGESARSVSEVEEEEDREDATEDTSRGLTLDGLRPCDKKP